MSVDLVDVYRSLLGHWPGLILLALSVLTLAFVLATLWVMLRPDALNRRPQRHQLASGLRFCEEAAPAVGLVGTVYGLTGGFFAVGTEELPAFIGTALQTTYVGGILFLLALASVLGLARAEAPSSRFGCGGGRGVRIEERARERRVDFERAVVAATQGGEERGIDLDGPTVRSLSVVRREGA